MKILKRLFILVFMLANTFALFAQTAAKMENEEVILSFESEQGKLIGLYKNKLSNTIIFKTGTDQVLEMIYPESGMAKKEDFTYSFYLRGGGSANEGLDLKYVYFTSGDFKYVIYETSYFGTLKTNVGLKIINLKLSQTADIKAKDGTVRGTMIPLRDSELLAQGEELFD